MQNDNDFGAVANCRHGKDPAACNTCIRDKERKQEKRDLQRNEKLSKAASDTSQTCDAFWKAQRSLVSPSTLAPLLERQERVLDSLHWLRHQLDGSYNDPTSPHYTDPNDSECYVSFEEGAVDIIRDYETFGYCQTEISWNEFWKDTELFQMLTSRNDATATFARYGILIAFPEHQYGKFQKFLKQKYMLEKFGMHVPEYVYVGAEVLAPDYDGKGYPTENRYQAY